MKNLHFISFIFLLTITSISAQPGLDWVAQMSGDEIKAGYSTTLDSDGNLYVTGYFYGTVDFDPGTGVNELTAPAGEKEIFVAKLDDAGNLLWVSDLGKGMGRSIVYDNGAVYVTGNYTYVAGGVLVSGIYMKKLDADTGNLVLEYYIVDESGTGLSISVHNGDIYVAGYFYGSLDFDASSANAYASSNGESDIFILKLTASGDFSWVKTMGGVMEDKAMAVDVDDDGVYVTGVFRDTVDFTPADTYTGTLIAPDDYDDIFVLHYNLNGDYQWLKQIGGNYNDIGSDILKQGDAIYIGGYFIGECDFNPNATNYILDASTSGYDAYILKLNLSGNLIWVKRFDGVEDAMLRTIALDNDNNVYATGYFKGTMIADPSGGTNHNLISNGGYDIFQLKLNGTDSELDWAYSYGSSENDAAVSLSVTPDGASVYSTGYFNQTVDFDPDDSVAFELLSTGEEDIFVQKLSLTSGAVNQDVVGAGWKVYPNPFSDNFEINLQDEKIKSIEITDFSGKRVYVNNQVNANHFKVQGQYPTGLYFVKVTATSATHIFKMIKK